MKKEKDENILHLAYDSRKIQSAENTLFFALKTAHADGHQFVESVYKKRSQEFCSSAGNRHGAFGKCQYYTG